jgi:hypothetical protein
MSERNLRFVSGENGEGLTQYWKIRDALSPLSFPLFGIADIRMQRTYIHKQSLNTTRWGERKQKVLLLFFSFKEGKNICRL